MKKLYGITTAMTTPFDKFGAVDVGSLEEQVRFLISKGVDCLYPVGTTGEMLLCTLEERKLIARTVVEAAAGDATVFVHVGAIAQTDTIELARHAERIGADGIGVVTPPFHVMNERALEEFYCAVCGAVSENFPVYAYNIPQLSGTDLSPEVLQRIMDRASNLIGIKYSFPDMSRILDYLTVNDGNISVLPGADHLLLPSLAMGCDGVVSGCSGPYPEPFVEIYRLFNEGEWERARQVQIAVNRVIVALRGGADMSIFKAALTRRGVPAGFVRKPLVELPHEEMASVMAVLEELTSGLITD